MTGSVFDGEDVVQEASMRELVCNAKVRAPTPYAIVVIAVRGNEAIGSGSRDD